LVERLDREAEVLPGAREVGELEVHHPDAVLLREGQDVLGLDLAPGDVALDGQRGHRTSLAEPSTSDSPFFTPGTRFAMSSSFIPVSASITAGNSATTCVTSFVILDAPGEPPLPPIITILSVFASGADTAAAISGRT